jgi:hypothetical protein
MERLKVSLYALVIRSYGQCPAFRPLTAPNHPQHLILSELHFYKVVMLGALESLLFHHPPLNRIVEGLFFCAFGWYLILTPHTLSGFKMDVIWDNGKMLCGYHATDNAVDLVFASGREDALDSTVHSHSSSAKPVVAATAAVGPTVGSKLQQVAGG